MAMLNQGYSSEMKFNECFLLVILWEIEYFYQRFERCMLITLSCVSPFKFYMPFVPTTSNSAF